MSTKFDVEDMEVTVNGKTFSVYASFGWERKAVDYVFSRARNQGADVYAEIPAFVERADISPLPVDESERNAVLQATLDAFRNSEKGERNQETGKWL